MKYSVYYKTNFCGNLIINANSPKEAEKTALDCLLQEIKSARSIYELDKNSEIEVYKILEEKEQDHGK
jgi:hypothetical protein